LCGLEFTNEVGLSDMCAPDAVFRVPGPVGAGVEPATEESPMTYDTTLTQTDRGWNEREVLDGLRRGEDDAYEQLFRRYGGRMLATARRLLGNDEDARDAVQEAMLSAFKAVGRFEGGAQIGTWLHRIVVNAALMRMRSRRRKPEASIEDLLPDYQADGHRLLRAEGDPYPDELVEKAQLLALLRACVDELPDGYKQVYVLRDVEEMSNDEVALAMGLTPNAVKIRLHRARQALMTLVQQRYVAKSLPGARGPGPANT
jgi:RNA polymerase sigma-70 factor (ECF subfamily)